MILEHNGQAIITKYIERIQLGEQNILNKIDSDINFYAKDGHCIGSFRYRNKEEARNEYKKIINIFKKEQEIERSR